MTKEITQEEVFAGEVLKIINTSASEEGVEKDSEALKIVLKKTFDGDINLFLSLLFYKMSIEDFTVLKEIAS